MVYQEREPYSFQWPLQYEEEPSYLSFYLVYLYLVWLKLLPESMHCHQPIG